MKKVARFLLTGSLVTILVTLLVAIVFCVKRGKLSPMEDQLIGTWGYFSYPAGKPDYTLEFDRGGTFVYARPGQEAAWGKWYLGGRNRYLLLRYLSDNAFENLRHTATGSGYSEGFEILSIDGQQLTVRPDPHDPASTRVYSRIDG